MNMNKRKVSDEYTKDDAIIRDIRNAITGLDYGTVTIKVHNAKIMQVEITQKKRYDDAGQFEKGDGI